MSKQLAVLAVVVTVLVQCKSADAQRVDVWRMSPALRYAVAREIYLYISLPVVNRHEQMFDSGMHRDGETFLDMHRQMIRDLERHLAAQGLPMPVWNPATPIPPEFVYVKRFDKPMWWINNANPRIGLTPNHVYWIYNSRNERQLGEVLLPWHDAVHNSVGGAMAQRYSPTAVIFWPWHAYVDELYRVWEANRP